MDFYKNNQRRITKAACANEMEEVMDIYEDYVNEPLKKDKLSTIREQSFEDTQSTKISTNDSHQGDHKIISNVMTNKKHTLKNNLVNKMGRDNFEYVYQYLRDSRDQNVEEKKIIHHLKGKFGKDIQSCLIDVDQLIFFEDQNKM